MLPITETALQGDLDSYPIEKRGLCSLTFVFFLFLFFGGFFAFFRATPMVHGSSQARDRIRATSAGLHHSHSQTGSELHLRLTPQLMVMLDP